MLHYNYCSFNFLKTVWATKKSIITTQINRLYANNIKMLSPHLNKIGTQKKTWTYRTFEILNKIFFSPCLKCKDFPGNFCCTSIKLLLFFCECRKIGKEKNFFFWVKMCHKLRAINFFALPIIHACFARALSLSLFGFWEGRKGRRFGDCHLHRVQKWINWISLPSWYSFILIC